MEFLNMVWYNTVCPYPPCISLLAAPLFSLPPPRLHTQTNIILFPSQLVSAIHLQCGGCYRLIYDRQIAAQWNGVASGKASLRYFPRPIGAVSDVRVRDAASSLIIILLMLTDVTSPCPREERSGGREYSVRSRVGVDNLSRGAFRYYHEDHTTRAMQLPGPWVGSREAHFFYHWIVNSQLSSRWRVGVANSRATLTRSSVRSRDWNKKRSAPSSDFGFGRLFSQRLIILQFSCV